VKGRQYPVKIFHTALSQTDYIDAALRTFFQIHTDEPVGDVLIFLPGSFLAAFFVGRKRMSCPGQEDIESLERSIQLYANRLPQEGMRVGLSHFVSSVKPNFQLCLGFNLSHVWRSIALPTIESLPSDVPEYPKMCIGN
jgi:ATP-dependent RNA helicase DHX33